MNSMYGGDAPPGPSGEYGSGSGGSTVEGSGGETSGDAAYYQVTRGAEYGHHYAAGSEQYEVLSRAIINSDGSMRDAPQTYYSLEPHRPIPIHPSSTLSPIPTPRSDAILNPMPKREGSDDLIEESESGRNGMIAPRTSRSKSSSFDGGDKPEMSDRESSLKRKKADQARARYHRMSEEERKDFNLRRRLRQRGIDESGHPLPPTPKQMDKVHEANRRKAEAARNKYHQMSLEEKKEYNLRRTEAFRRKRREEEQLMMSPAMRISQESYDKAQAIMSRNSRKASAARERYARMSTEERKEYNQRRADLKRKREREQLERKMLMEAEGMEGMRHLCEASEVARGMEDYDESQGYSKEEGDERREQEGEEQLVDHVEVVDDSVVVGSPSDSSPSSPTLMVLPPLVPPLPPLVPPSGPLEESEERGRRVVRAREGVIKRREPTKTAQRIIRAVEEAHSNLEYERRRSEYEERWSIHGNSLDGVLIEDGAGVVYAGETSGHMEVGEDLHHMQTRSASAGVYEYGDHTMEDHYGEGAEMVEHEVEVPHSPHHRMHHVHHMEADIDVVHADDDDMQDWDSDAQLLSMTGRPYQPRERTQQLQLLLEDTEGRDVMSSARIVEQRAKRALRSRLRYANMSSEEKARHNAERAKQLRESRRRDMQLLQMADNEEVMMDEQMRKMVEAAQERRNRRAEQARHKYRRMSEEERRAYNAMRDAQRRSRRRDLEGLTDGEEREEREGREDSRTGEEMRRVRGGGRSSSAAASSIGGRNGGGAIGGRGGGGVSAAPDHHHHHLQRAGDSEGHYAYEMYEQEWTGDH